MRGSALLLLPLALVAGCRGDSNPANDADGRAIRMANEYHDAWMKLPPGQLRLEIMQAVRRTGNRCQRVDNAGYQEEYQNMRMWVAECGVERRSYAVFIPPNGEVQVRDCADAGTLSLPRCQGLPPPASDDGAPPIQNGASDEAYRQRPAVPDNGQ